MLVCINLTYSQEQGNIVTIRSTIWWQKLCIRHLPFCPEFVCVQSLVLKAQNSEFLFLHTSQLGSQLAQAAGNILHLISYARQKRTNSYILPAKKVTIRHEAVTVMQVITASLKCTLGACNGSCLSPPTVVAPASSYEHFHYQVGVVKAMSQQCRLNDALMTSADHH